MTLRVATNLGNALLAQHKADEAEALFRTTFEIERLLYGPHHEVTVRSAENLAAALRQLGREEEAASLAASSLLRRLQSQDPRLRPVPLTSVARKVVPEVD